MTKLAELADLGQSIWLDFIERGFMEAGEMRTLIDRGLRGVTSNPSIFDKAISGSDRYDSQLGQLAKKGHSTEEIYQAVVISDIQTACDMFRPVYDSTGGLDGYISLEVSPDLAHDTEMTIAEVRSYWDRVARPNLMIKIPATDEGYPAVEKMIGEGINVNVTLMFSVEQYDRVAQAYLSGLEQLLASGGDLSRSASVASFFVSRVDTKVDKALEEIGGAEDLLGQIGVANAKLAYRRFQETFAGPRWDALNDGGAQVQRVLWGSTSTKNPAYSDTMYIDDLIGPHTVNTVPPGTLQAFLDHGTVARTVDSDVEQAQHQVDDLHQHGLVLSQVTNELLTEGVKKFADSYHNLLGSIEAKCSELAGDTTSEEKVGA